MKELCDLCNREVGEYYVYIHYVQPRIFTTDVFFHPECFTIIAGKEYMAKLTINPKIEPGAYTKDLDINKLQNIHTYDNESCYNEWYKGEEE